MLMGLMKIKFIYLVGEGKRLERKENGRKKTKVGDEWCREDEKEVFLTIHIYIYIYFFFEE